MPKFSQALRQFQPIFHETARRIAEWRHFDAERRRRGGGGGRGQKRRHDIARPRREAPIAVGLGLDMLGLDDIADQGVAIGVGRFEHDGRAVAARKIAAAGGAIIVGDDDELPFLVDRLALELKIEDATRVGLDELAVLVVTRGLGHIDAISDAVDDVEIIGGEGGVEQRLFGPGLRRSDIESAFAAGDLAALIPNDYRLVREAIDRGVPLDEVRPGNKISQEVKKLVATGSGVAGSGVVRNGTASAVHKPVKMGWAR